MTELLKKGAKYYIIAMSAVFLDMNLELTCAALTYAFNSCHSRIQVADTSLSLYIQHTAHREFVRLNGIKHKRTGYYINETLST